jgi:hypothetical protein
MLREPTIDRKNLAGNETRTGTGEPGGEGTNVLRRAWALRDSE